MKMVVWLAMMFFCSPMEGDDWRLEGFDKPLAVDKDSIPFLRGGSFGFCQVKATNALLKQAAEYGPRFLHVI